LAQRRSLRLAGSNPPREDVDALLWPRTVTRHGAIAHAFENYVSVRADIGVSSQIESELHRLAITLAEEHLDVLSKLHLLVQTRQRLRAIVRLVRRGEGRDATTGWSGARTPIPMRCSLS
jgi:hypothetical protein